MSYGNCKDLYNANCCSTPIYNNVLLKNVSDITFGCGMVMSATLFNYLKTIASIKISNSDNDLPSISV